MAGESPKSLNRSEPMIARSAGAFQGDSSMAIRLKYAGAGSTRLRAGFSVDRQDHWGTNTSQAKVRKEGRMM